MYLTEIRLYRQKLHTHNVPNFAFMGSLKIFSTRTEDTRDNWTVMPRWVLRCGFRARRKCVTGHHSERLLMLIVVTLKLVVVKVRLAS